MNKILTSILLLLIFVSCKNNNTSDLDIARGIEHNNQAIEFILIGEIDKAKESYLEAIRIDKFEVSYYYELTKLYNKEKQYIESAKLLESMPIELQTTELYYIAKGRTLEAQNEIKLAVENYKKALDLNDKISINNELDLMSFTGFATLLTVTGQKEIALKEINNVLEKKWLSESNIEYLNPIRNEIEFYQGNGFKDFEITNEIKICTDNPDSLKNVLNKKHINISGVFYKYEGNQNSYLTVGEKFRKGIEKLNLKTCD